MESDNISVGERIKKLMKERKIKTKELAKLTDMSYHTLFGAFKRENQNMTVETLHRIAECLGTTMDYLRTGNEKYRFSVSCDARIESGCIHLKNLDEKRNQLLKTFIDDLFTLGRYDCKKAEDSPTITYDEYVRKFFSLNEEGQTRVKDYLDDLVLASLYAGILQKERKVSKKKEQQIEQQENQKSEQ